MLSLSKILSDAASGASVSKTKKAGTSKPSKKSENAALAAALRSFRDAKTDDEIVSAWESVKELEDSDEAEDEEE